MGRLLVCPNGHRIWLDQETEGSRIVCAVCNAVVVEATAARNGPAAASVIAPVIRDSSSGLERATLGLGFHYGRMILFTLCLFALLGADILLTTRPKPKPLTTAELLADKPEKKVETQTADLLRVSSIIGLSFAVPLLGVIGSLLCLLVPRETLARAYILVALVLDLLHFSASCGLRFVRQLDTTEAQVALLSHLILGLGAWMLFMLFLKQLASHLGRDDLSRDSVSVLGLGFIVFLGGLGVLMMMEFLLLQEWTFLFAVVSLCLSVGVVFEGLFFWQFLKVIRAIRKAMQDGVPES